LGQNFGVIFAAARSPARVRQLESWAFTATLCYERERLFGDSSLNNQSITWEEIKKLYDQQRVELVDYD